MIKQFIILLIYCVLGAGCTSSKTEKKKDSFIGEPEKLQIDSITIPPILLSVSSLFTMNDTLIAYGPRNDTIFSFWKLPDCQYLFSAGKKGQGPEDFLMLDKNFVDTQNGFKTFEIATNRIKEVGINKKGRLSLLSQQQLKNVPMPLNRFLFLADSSYCFVSSDQEEYEYSIIDKKGKIRHFSSYPSELLPMGIDDNPFFLYNKLTIAKPDGSQFAAFYVNLKMVRIYDYKGNIQKETILEKPEKPDQEGRRKMYYTTSLCADDNYIYAVTTLDEKPILEVWTWKGEPYKRYWLDYQFKKMAFSPQYRKLYSVRDDREDKIYTYTLPDFTQKD